MRRLLVVALVALFAAPAALASPVAKSDAEYLALGRVFPDPLAACSIVAPPCSPTAQGNVPAVQFIQFAEFVDALTYMNSKPEWQRYLEVLVLDGKLGDGSGTEPGNAMFPGNTMSRLEFTPKPEYHSAGLPTPTLDRKVSDLFVVRVTDETVPDAGKKRIAISLSIHGIERAGLEGGTRAMEDLVTAYTTGKAAKPIVPAGVKANAPTYADVLRRTIIYFTYPNPDGWRRGSVSEGGVFFQRYNGNGIDPNRDWPDLGYTFRPYSGASEPETRALLGFYGDLRGKGYAFAAGDDLHGQPGADALSYTLLPHGRHDYGKDLRIRDAAMTINRSTYDAVKWSPIIQPNSGPQPTCGGTSVATVCAPMYGQTWGTVYDTINYTTTGALGDWFDSPVGLGADGIDNEMSFSHLDRNIVFEPHGEQLHVDGNKALLYAHLASLLNPPTGTFDAPGAKAYVPGVRLTRAAQSFEGSTKKTNPQPDYADLRGTADPAAGGDIVVPFKVYRSTPKGKALGIYNGGMRVDVTASNVQGIGNAATVTLKVQCQGCDHHVGVDDGSGEWITVAEDYNQSPLYLQAGLTAAVNAPEGSLEGKNWRAVISAGTAQARVDVHFFDGPATTDGATGGDSPPSLRAYDVANTDFFTDLNRFIPDSTKRFAAINPRDYIGTTKSLGAYKSIVLADDALPGYTGFYGASPPSGPPTAAIAFEDTKPTAPGQGPDTCARTVANTDDHDFTIAPNDGNSLMTVRVEWTLPVADWDVYLMKKDASGEYHDTGLAGTSFITSFEEFEVPFPGAGDYRVQVVNCAALDPNYTGSVTFAPLAPQSQAVGAYSLAQKNAWLAKLRAYVQAGGNLVLTDGALKALPELTNGALSSADINRQIVYTGQVAFATAAGATPTSGANTLSDPLAKNVAQPGARFQTGMRRQTFEPTPLGYSIQDAAGGDSAGARQYDVDRASWEAAGGRTVATSANSGDRDAAAVYNRVTVGELRLGAGTIRIAGALLPQPSTEEDHPLGLEPYAVTYTGYILVRNLFEVGS